MLKMISMSEKNTIFQDRSVLVYCRNNKLRLSICSRLLTLGVNIFQSNTLSRTQQSLKKYDPDLLLIYFDNVCREQLPEILQISKKDRPVILLYKEGTSPGMESFIKAGIDVRACLCWPDAEETLLECVLQQLDKNSPGCLPGQNNKTIETPEPAMPEGRITESQERAENINPSQAQLQELLETVRDEYESELGGLVYQLKLLWAALSNIESPTNETLSRYFLEELERQRSTAAALELNYLHELFNHMYSLVTQVPPNIAEINLCLDNLKRYARISTSQVLEWVRHKETILYLGTSDKHFKDFACTTAATGLIIQTHINEQSAMAALEDQCFNAVVIDASALQQFSLTALGRLIASSSFMNIPVCLLGVPATSTAKYKAKRLCLNKILPYADPVPALNEIAQNSPAFNFQTSNILLLSDPILNDPNETAGQLVAELSKHRFQVHMCSSWEHLVTYEQELCPETIIFNMASSKFSIETLIAAINSHKIPENTPLFILHEEYLPEHLRTELQRLKEKTSKIDITFGTAPELLFKLRRTSGKFFQSH